MLRRRILFAGNFNWFAGSSHMIAEYAAVADRVGCDIGVSTQLAQVDAVVAAQLPLVDDIQWATHLVLVFEGRQFLNEQQMRQCEQIPRHRRVIIDPDGHWGPPVHIGADNNYGRYPHESWHQLYKSLSDRILQPKLDGHLPQGAEFFSYFGMPQLHRYAVDAPAPDEMSYQLQYIGNNWWRWPSLIRIVTAVINAGPPVARMRVCGRWWNGEVREGHEEAAWSEAGWLRRHGVEVAPSVPFGQVVTEMSASATTPILSRPLLAKMGLLTPRMFETLASGSLPIIDSNLAYVVDLYGDGAASFLLGDDPHKAVARMLRDHSHHRRLVTAMQTRMYRHFGYERVLAHLLRLLE